MLFFALAPAVNGFGQVTNFTDGFEDGNFTVNPEWNGDDTLYTVVQDSRNHLLQLQGDAENGGINYLSTPSSDSIGSWEVYIQLDFSPSGSNKADIFLMSDMANLRGPVNGYALRAGESGTADVFRLVRYDAGSESEVVLSGTTDISSGGDFRVKVTREGGGIWSMAVGLGYDGQLEPEGGTQTDATHASTRYFGVRSTYTSTRHDLFSYDFKIDLPAFTITGATASDNQVELSFNRKVDQGSVQPTDFTIDNGMGSPSSISFPSASVVRLSYDHSLLSNVYTLTASNIEDQHGNSIATDTTAQFIVYGNYKKQDIIITEFMYDQPSGQAEYVELKNISDKFLNLQNWRIGDNSGDARISADTLTLAPYGYLAVSSDTSALFHSHGSQPYVESLNLPAFNNGGDVVHLITAAGASADSLSYTPSWGGSGVALERRSAATPALYMENWGDSTHPEAGTPGQPNTLPRDTTAPRLIALQVASAQKLKLAFNERLEVTTASAPSNYSLTNTAITTARVIEPDTAELALATPLQNASSYTLAVTNIEDIFGNAMIQTDSTFTHYTLSEADSGDVVINEFMYSPPPVSSEYVEIYNRSAKSFDLQDWTFSDNRGMKRLITNKPYILPPDSFVAVAPDSTLAISDPGLPLLIMDDFPSLNNGGDQILIHRRDSTLLDSLAYTSGWGGEQLSLERRSPDVAGIYTDNWAEAPEGFGTPGAPNTIEPDTKPPELSSLSVKDGTLLTLTFSERLSGSAAEEPENYTLVSETAIINARYSPPDSVFLKLDDNLQNGSEYTLSIENIGDIFGNTISSEDTLFTHYRLSSADSGDVFINEFMYDPPEGFPEYIELFNASSKTLNLQNWTLNDNTGHNVRITAQEYPLPPGGFAVLSADSLPIPYPVIRMLNRSPSLNNNGDHIVLRDSSGSRLDSLQYSGDWGGMQVALERRSHTLAGYYRANWGLPSDSTGSPGSKNTVSPDETPPSIEVLDLTDPQTLQLIFSEHLDSTSLANSFSFSGTPAIDDIQFLLPDTTQIKLSSPMQNAVSYTLTLSGIRDLFDNVLPQIDTTFTFYRSTVADSGDIFINEFSYNPASGQTEYLELFNPTDHSFDLQNWTLNDNRGLEEPLTPHQLILPPDSFVVLAPDNTLLKSHPGIRLLSMGTRFPALNNSGDQIVLKNKNGIRLDSLQYTSSWGGREIALERRTTSVAATYAENWGPAPEITGSPGRPNSITADQTPPEIHNLHPLGRSSLQLLFSEHLSVSSATSFDNYQIIPHRELQLVSVQSDSVTLFLATPLASGETYTLETSGITDIFGNALPPESHSFKYLRLEKAIPGDIIINEILADPGNDMVEFIELYNRSDKNIDLRNWSLGDAQNEITLPAGTELQSRHYLVLVPGSLPSQIPGTALVLPRFPNLNNSSDALFIRNSAGLTIDSLYYQSSWNMAPAGHSMERKDPHAASNDPSNWTSNSSDAGSSAGAENLSFEEDQTPPVAHFATIRSDGKIEIHFSEFIRHPEKTQFILNGNLLSIAVFDSLEADRVTMNHPAANIGGSNPTIHIKHLEDVRGNITPSSNIPLAQPLEPGTLVINEIMYHPVSVPDDQQPDQSEYIELYNRSDHTVSLEGLRLHEAPDEKGQFQELHPARTATKWVAPKQTVLIYADQAPTYSQSDIVTFFELDSTRLQAILQIDRSSLSLSSGEEIYLADSTGTTIDSVHYRARWHNPNLVDTRGIALERITPGGPTNEQANWGSSVHPRGGTPKAVNSIYQENTEQPEQEGILLTPNPFSPDGDGFEDQLIINYKLDQPDYLLRVTIFDRYGRFIKKLADGKPAGFEGSLLWDGRRDGGRRNRIGIYVIVFEAYDSASGANIAYKKAIVLARKLH
ncbi:lamin tail domain-containing protein [Fodinibius sediminis]|nr:lamin tail domain-containing protein [Fodinibius sediminis]